MKYSSAQMSFDLMPGKFLASTTFGAANPDGSFSWSVSRGHGELTLFERREPPAAGVPTLLLRAAEQPLLAATGGRAPVPPPDVTEALDVPGDHVSMLGEHAGAVAAAVERWVGTELAAPAGQPAP